MEVARPRMFAGFGESAAVASDMNKYTNTPHPCRVCSTAVYRILKQRRRRITRARGHVCPHAPPSCCSSGAQQCLPAQGAIKSCRSILLHVLYNGLDNVLRVASTACCRRLLNAARDKLVARTPTPSLCNRAENRRASALLLQWFALCFWLCCNKRITQSIFSGSRQQQSGTTWHTRCARLGLGSRLSRSHRLAKLLHFQISVRIRLDVSKIDTLRYKRKAYACAAWVMANTNELTVYIALEQVAEGRVPVSPSCRGLRYSSCCTLLQSYVQRVRLGITTTRAILWQRSLSRAPVWVRKVTTLRINNTKLGKNNARRWVLKLHSAMPYGCNLNSVHQLTGVRSLPPQLQHSNLLQVNNT